jgi:hypothetical protein
VELDVEIWPTSMTLDRRASGCDWSISANDDYIPHAGWAPGLRHNDPDDRPAGRFAGENTILSGGRLQLAPAAAGHPAVAD